VSVAGPGSCFFCGQFQAEDRYAYEQPMRYCMEVKLGSVWDNYSRSTKWKSTTVKVPRCARCWRLHRKGLNLGLRDILLIFGLPVVVFALTIFVSGLLGYSTADAVSAAVWLGFASGLVAVIICAIMGGMRCRKLGVHPESYGLEFGAIRRLEAEGWEKPPANQ
jgi:hypothetical protein